MKTLAQRLEDKTKSDKEFVKRVFGSILEESTRIYELTRTLQWSANVTDSMYLQGRQFGASFFSPGPGEKFTRTKLERDLEKLAQLAYKPVTEQDIVSPAFKEGLADAYREITFGQRSERFEKMLVDYLASKNGQP